jgi:hypothetical protein
LGDKLNEILEFATAELSREEREGNEGKTPMKILTRITQIFTDIF